MSEMSEKYLEVLIQVKGTNLEPRSTNAVISHYDMELKNLKVSKEENGRVFKASVDHIDNRKHELIDKDTLLLSRQIKLNIYSNLHDPNNGAHKIYVKLHQALMGLKVESSQTKNEKIVAETIDTHQGGDFRKKKWPMDTADKLFAFV